MKFQFSSFQATQITVKSAYIALENPLILDKRIAKNRYLLFLPLSAFFTVICAAYFFKIENISFLINSV